MYDMDPRDPWDRSDYARFFCIVFVGLLVLAAIAYPFLTLEQVCCCP